MPLSHNLVVRRSRTTAKSVDTFAGHKAPRENRFPKGFPGSNPGGGVFIRNRVFPKCNGIYKIE